MRTLIAFLFLLASSGVIAEENSLDRIFKDTEEMQRRAQLEERLGQIESKQRMDDALRQQEAIHQQTEGTLRQMEQDSYRQENQRRMEELEQQHQRDQWK